MENEKESSNDASLGQCGRCGVEIGDEAKLACGKLYHFECFVCASCCAQMTKYTVRNGKMYCPPCNRSMFGPHCAECGRPLCGSESEDKTAVFALGNLYHSGCLVCAECEEPITGKFYVSEVEECYCRKHPPKGTTPELIEQCNASNFAFANDIVSSSMKIRNLGDCIADYGHCYDNSDAKFWPKKILILAKLTRLEFERCTNPGLTEEKLEEVLEQRGSDYTRLLQHHGVHKQFLNVIRRELEKREIEHKVVQRWEYNKDAIDWADAVFTAGGDGTFLLGASKIRDRNKSIIGINTDPTSSEGYLCLKKLPDTHFPDALDRLMAGQFRQLMYPEYRWSEDVKEQESSRLWSRSQLKPRSSSATSDGALTPATTSNEVSSNPFSNGESTNEPCRVLPYLALNDVYIGESLSSRVSYCELKIDDQEKVKQKSSGLTVCTGTGSTSWYFNINKLTDDCVSSLLEIMKEEVPDSVGASLTESAVVSRICKKFNDKLLFCPSDLRMAYAIRDQVCNATFRPIPSRGFASKRVEVKSRCFDAHLVIDGGMSYIFNSGAKAELEIHPEDALRTVVFH